MSASHTCMFVRDLSDIAGSSATHPCPFCERKINTKTSIKSHMLADKRRSCASNRHHFKNYRRSKSADSKKFASCVADPLTCMLQVYVFSKLTNVPHIHMYMFTSALLPRISLDVHQQNMNICMFTCVYACVFIFACLQFSSSRPMSSHSAAYHRCISTSF